MRNLPNLITLTMGLRVHLAEYPDHDLLRRLIFYPASTIERTTVILASARKSHPFQCLRIKVWAGRNQDDRDGDEIWSKFDNCFSPNPFLEAWRRVEFSLLWRESESRVHRSEVVESLKKRLAIGQGRGMLQFYQI